MNRYEGKVVLITGAGDVTQATSARLLQEGAKIALLDYSKKALEEVVQQLADEGYPTGNIMSLPCNVCKMGECEAVTNKVVEKWSRIDTLVVTAGITRHCSIDEMSDEDWQAVIDVNLTGVFHSVKSVVPIMKKQRQGHIVLISSIGGRTGRPGVGVNYAASKAGVNGMAMNLAYALGPWNINVNSIAPGPLKGRMFLTMKPEQVEKLSSGCPLGRIGEMSDIAAAIAYLGSDEASWTTGEVLDVNGGLQF